MRKSPEIAGPAGRRGWTRSLLAVASLLLFGTAALQAGPVVIDGTDANDHGSTTGTNNVLGWVYMQKVLDNLGSQVGPGLVKVVVDLGTTDGTQARDAINSAFSLSTLPAAGWTLTHVEGATAIDSWLANLSPANTGILYIPSAGETDGDLGDADLAVVNTRSQAIDNFVAGGGNPALGGALFAMGESPFAAVQPYGWLIALLPTVTVTDLGAGGVSTPLTLTPDGQSAFPGLANADLSAGPWHDYFLGNFGGLRVLATALDDSGISRNLILGGGAGTSFQPSHTSCITRTAQFWFAHPDSDATNCATLFDAIIANGQQVDLGFITLPARFENNDNFKNATDALIEALGFYYKGPGKTGDGFAASKLCRARKQLASELIAAIANTQLLGTSPANCSYQNGSSLTNFPADLVTQAQAVAASEDAVAMNKMQVLLKKFNSSGLTNNFVEGLVECSPYSSKAAKSIARDPTDKLHCPGLNDTCFTAVPVIFPPPKNMFTFPKFNDSLDTRQVSSTGEAWWKLEPPIAANGRQFTVDTSKSNFQTQLDVLTGSCLLAGSNGVNTVTNSLTSIFGIPSSNAVPPEAVSFSTDGSRTYFIKVTGGTGKVQIRVTSP